MAILKQVVDLQETVKRLMEQNDKLRGELDALKKRFVSREVRANGQCQCLTWMGTPATAIILSTSFIIIALCCSLWL